MGKLPRASDAKNDQLDQNPPYDTAVGALRLVAKLSLSFLQRALSVTILFKYCVASGGSSNKTVAGKENDELTLWKTCSLRMSLRRALRS